jgi:hypothetical protein
MGLKNQKDVNKKYGLQLKQLQQKEVNNVRRKNELKLGLKQQILPRLTRLRKPQNKG